MTIKQSQLFQIGIYVIIASVFSLVAYFFGKNSVDTFLPEANIKVLQVQNEMLSGLIELYKKESVEAKAELSATYKPDRLPIINQKEKLIYVESIKEVQLYRELKTNDRIAYFNMLAKRLPSMPDSLRQSSYKLPEY